MKPERPSALAKQIARMNGLCGGCTRKKAEKDQDYCKECLVRRAKWK